MLYHNITGFKTYLYQKDEKALRYKPRNIVTDRQQEIWLYNYYNYRPKYDPQTIHCKGMCFGACQDS